jgi:hypothetical protein
MDHDKWFSGGIKGLLNKKKHCPNFVEEGCFSLRGKGLDKRQG